MESRKSYLNYQINKLESNIAYTKELLQNILSLNPTCDVNNTGAYLQTVRLQHRSLETILAINMMLNELLLGKNTGIKALATRPTSVALEVEEAVASAPIENVDFTQQCKLNCIEKAEEQSLLQVTGDSSQTDHKSIENKQETGHNNEDKKSSVKADNKHTVSNNSNILSKLLTLDDSKKSCLNAELELALPDIFFKVSSHSPKSTTRGKSEGCRDNTEMKEDYEGSLETILAINKTLKELSPGKNIGIIAQVTRPSVVKEEETIASAPIENVDFSQQCELNCVEKVEDQSLLQVSGDSSQTEHKPIGNKQETGHNNEDKKSLVKADNKHTVTNNSNILSKLLALEDSKKSSLNTDLELALPDIFFKVSSHSPKSTTRGKNEGCRDNTKIQENYSNEMKTSDRHLIQDPPEIQIGDICFVSHVISPVKFYILVINDDTAKLDEISTRLGDFYEKHTRSFHRKEDAVKAIKKFCAVCVDRFWYRGEILDWLQNESTGHSDNVRVQLIDHGHEQILSFRCLRKLLPSFCKLPKLAHQCRLSYIYPCGSTPENRQTFWDAKSVEGFLRILGDLNKNMFKIIYTYRPNKRKSTHIEFVNTNEEDEANCIGQLLINEKVAVEIIDQQQDQFHNSTFINRIKAVHGLMDEDLDEETMELKKVENYFNSVYEEEANTLSEALLHYNPRDEAETCRQMLRTGHCYRGRLCKYRHVPLTDGFTRDQVPVFRKALAEYAPLKAGEEVTVRISHICNIKQFYVQVIRDFYIGETLERLIEIMNAPEIVKKYKYLDLTPAVGELVIVKHWNNYWYRGMVTDIMHYERPKKVEVTVFVVDFGDTLTVSMNDLRTISEAFLHLPFQAYLCRFSNVRHKEGEDEEEETSHFERTRLGSRLRAKIIANPGYLIVQLFHRGVDVGLKLISEGYGEFEDHPIYPSDEFLLLC